MTARASSAPERQSAASAARDVLNTPMPDTLRIYLETRIAALLESRERPLLEQITALREVAVRFLEVQRKWHGAKSEDEVRYWDSIGPEAHDQLVRAIASTAAAAREHDQRVITDFVARVNARAEADMLAGNPVTGAHHRAIEVERARSQTEGA